MPPELKRLMERYCELGRLLPAGDDVDRAAALDDPDTRSQAILALAEMDKVKAQIDAFLAADRKRRGRQ